MPARDLRLTDTQTEPASSLLVTPGLSLQQMAVELVLADWEAAKADRMSREYGTDAKGNRLDFEKWRQELRDLYFGQRLPKVIPWRFCSNRSLMIAMAILEVLHAQIFPAVYNEELTRWRPTEPTDEDTAKRVERFMYWWIRVHAKLREFFDRWTRYTIGFGSTLTVSSWEVHLLDKGQQTPSQQQQNPDGSTSIIPPQKILDRWEVSRSDIIPVEDVFLQPGATNIQRDTVIIRRKYLYRDLEEMERNGQVININQPTEQGGKTLREFLVVPSVASQATSPDQQSEMENIRRRNIAVECLEWYGGIDLDGDTFPEPMRLLIVPQHRIYLGGIPISQLSKRGIRHLDLTMFMPRLDEPQGLRGMGVLEQVKELAMEIDAIFNQMTDANSLSILRPGFYDPSGDLDASALTLAPNKMTPVSRPQESVFFPNVEIPTDRLILAIRLVLEFIERLTAASSYILGKESEIVGGSGTATRTEAILGAARQRFAVPVERLREGAARIMTQHLDLVQLNLPPGMEQRVLGEKGEPIFGQNELTQEGLSGEFDAYLLPDESLGSKEAERQLSQMLYALLTQNLIVASDPTKLYKVTADVLSAYGKDPEQYLGVAPDVKQTDSPEDENTLILQGNLASVKASVLDNPIQHIMSHAALLQHPEFQTLPPAVQGTVGTFLQSHIAEHQQMLQLVLASAQKPKGGLPHAPIVGNGAPPRKPGPAPTVGPEPSVGSVQNPRAQAGGLQRAGEGQASP